MLWAVVLVGVLGLFLGGLWFFQRSMIFFPDASSPGAVESVLPGGEEVHLSTSDGLELAAWHVAAPDSDQETVLVAPGNAGNRAARVPLARMLVDAGFGVLLLDYRGYGGNPGSPTEAGLARDVRAAHHYLTAEADVGPEDLIYFGESVGAAVVTELAAEHSPAALVLRSPFTSLAEVGRAAYRVPVGWLLRDEFPVEERVGEAGAPVAVIYGDSDTIVPAEQSRAVAQASRRADQETVEISVSEADHNDPELSHGPSVLEAIKKVSEDQ